MEPCRAELGVPHLKVCILELKDWNLREEERRESCFRDGERTGLRPLNGGNHEERGFMRLKWMLSPRYQGVRQDNEFPVKCDTE